jgi:CHAD domain-containing protein
VREREVKFIVDGDADLGLARIEVPGASLAERRSVEIDDTYFDTRDLRLVRWGVTLRWREGAGWTVKIPYPSGDEALLDREEVVVASDAAEPPPEAVALVAPFARCEPLTVVARLRTERTSRTWRDADARAVAELVDDRVVGSSGGRTVRFREIEFELAPDADAGALEAVRDLIGGRGRPARPKLARVLGDAALDAPDVTVGALAKHPTGAGVIHVALADSVRRLLVHLPVARLGVDPEGVHQARVATRRLRSDLRTFGPLIDAVWASQVRRELQWLAVELGKVRDADVLDGHLVEVLRAHPEIDPDAGAEVRALLAAQRDRDRLELLGHLADRRAIDLLDHLVDAANTPRTRRRAEKPAVDVLPSLVDKAWRRLVRAVDTLGEPAQDVELHQVRILAKRLRYAAEAVAPAIGKDAVKVASAAASIQESLGVLNDASVAAAWLENASKSALDGPAAFAAGQIAQQLRIDTAELRGDWWRRGYEQLLRRTGWLSDQ